MRIYRVSYRDMKGGEQTGFTYHASRKEAEKAARQAKAEERGLCKIELTTVAKTKRADFIRYLNKYAGHPDNG